MEKNGGEDGEHVFHHDGTLLQCVQKLHESITNQRNSVDIVTVGLLVVIEMMLQESGSRPNAMTVHTKSKKVIGEAERKYDLNLTNSIRPYAYNDITALADRPQTPPQAPPDHSRSLGSSSSRKYRVPQISTRSLSEGSSIDDSPSASPTFPKSSFPRRQRNIHSAGGALQPRNDPETNQEPYKDQDISSLPAPHQVSRLERAHTSYAEPGTQYQAGDGSVKRNSRASRAKIETNASASNNEQNAGAFAPRESVPEITDSSKSMKEADSRETGASTPTKPGLTAPSSNSQIPVEDSTNAKDKGKSREPERPRPTLMLQEAITWKNAVKKHKEYKQKGQPPELPFNENLTQLNERDHVSELKPVTSDLTK